MVRMESRRYWGRQNRFGNVARVVAYRSGSYGACFTKHAVFDGAVEVSLSFSYAWICVLGFDGKHASMAFGRFFVYPCDSFRPTVCQKEMA